MTAAASSDPRISGYLGDETERALTLTQAVMVGALAFFLLAMNGAPLFWSSLPEVLGISALLMVQRHPRAIVAGAFEAAMRPITLLVLALAGISLVSAIVADELDSITEALLRSVAPLFPFFALAGVRIRARHAKLIIGGFVAGAAFMLLRATLAFYQEWGIPDLNTALWARYDQIRMSGYMTATLGNLAHMGLYISLVAPFLIAVVAYFNLGRKMNLAVVAILLLALLNAFVSGSRTAIVLIVPMAALIFARRGPGVLLVFFGILAAMALLGIAYGLDPVSQSDLIKRFLPSATATGFDESAVERVDSIYLGWAVFQEHPLLGVGPGMSPSYISYGIPHESLVHMLLELGIFGGTVFLALSLTLIGKALHAVIAPDPDGQFSWRAMWLVGPASYFLFGIIGGIAFNMSISLVWIGIVYTMVPLAFARIVGDDHT